MTILIDFDYTLLDTEKFKEQLSKCLINYNVSPKMFFKIYESMKSKKIPFKPINYYQSLPKHIRPNLSVIKEVFSSIASQCHQMLYPDTLWFLRHIKYLPRVKLILFSFRRSRLQEEKIKGAAIGKYFDQIVLTTDFEKGKFLEKIVKKDGKICFIDDRIDVLEKAQKRFSIFPILVVRDKKRTSRKQIPIFSGLREVFQYVKSLA